jgi:replicative DNA helicase
MLKDIFSIPCSIEAEQAILGGIILENDIFDIVDNRVSHDDFYKKGHKLIYSSIKYLLEKNIIVDLITLSEFLKKNNDLDKVGGKFYLDNLIRNTPGSDNMEIYVKIVKDYSSLRQLIMISKNIIDEALNIRNSDVQEIINNAEKKILSITKKNKSEYEIDDISKILSSTLRRIEMLFEYNSPVTGLSSGFKKLDELTSGLHKSDLIIIAGRPSMGKTTLAINIVENIIINNPVPILIFSMEMSTNQVATRMLSSIGKIDLQKLRTGILNDEDWPKLSYAVSLISGKNLFIDDSGSLSPFEISMKSRKLYKEYKDLGLIIIDYLQLMHVPGMHENRVSEISEISRSLKILAKDLNIPIIALSQLNRSLEQRIDKRPIMSDLRESGSIEQDSDLILFIYRDEIYNKNSSNSNKAEIIISKQRNGPLGIVPLIFSGQYSRFEDFIDNNENEENTDI